MKVRKNPYAVRLIFLSLFLLGSPLFGSHPFYVSICEMNYKSETESLEISLRIFTDDLERTLQDWGTEKLYLGELNESPKTDSLLKKYILQVLSIEIEGETTSVEFIGKEVEQALTWVYLEAKNVPNFDKIMISNRMLFQSFPEQTNLIHVNQRGKIKSLLLTKNNPTGELAWDKE